MRLKDYYRLAKPGMVYGNTIPALAGFLLASRWHVDIWLLLATILGIGLVMASGCVFNNVIDRDIDANMSRTKKRALVVGAISTQAALIYGTLLGFVGLAILSFQVNRTATWIAAAGFFFYVIAYSIWTKRHTPWGTVVGSVSGAIPPVVGYVAVTGSVDLAAWLLFGIMTAWQMPHFYAIAIRRKDEYAAAGIRILSVVHGIRRTKLEMIGWMVVFAILAPLLTVFGYTNNIYLVVSLILGLGWLGLGLKGLTLPDNDPKTITWAKKVFLCSLVVMMTLFVAIALTSS